MPLLHNADDAKRLVEYAKFPPTGKRGFGSPFSMANFGDLSQTEYLQQANESLITIVQIETREALNNVIPAMYQCGHISTDPQYRLTL